MALAQTREETLLALVLGKPAARRAAFLDAICVGDRPLRQRLEALLAAHENPKTLMATQTEAAPSSAGASARHDRSAPGIECTDTPDEAVGQTLRRYKPLEKVGDGKSWTFHGNGDTCGDPAGPSQNTPDAREP